MNGLYNIVAGCNPDTEQLLSILGLTISDVPRFRDCYLAGGDPPRIAVYTRMGGGNRGHWEFTAGDQVEGPDCNCPGCEAKYKLGGHPLYLSDKDDNFDCTYATYYFKLPEGADISGIEVADMTPEDKMKLVLDMLSSNK